MAFIDENEAPNGNKVLAGGPVAGHKQGAGVGMLSSGELKMMLGQCLKMASENKITAKNTWGLPLIEHLEDLIRDDQNASGRNTNFQKASVTLDAGVKIYSYRVDSVHTETFKMLGGLGRASGPGDEDEGGQGELGDGGVGQASPSKRKRRGGDLNPEATLESSLEALNVKKFDLAFAVDPLFHKTSAQFDEGGARGLLLNNLSVYQGCNLVFDSLDVPDTAVGRVSVVDSSRNQDESSACIRGDVDSMLAAAEYAGRPECRIAPALDDITSILGTLSNYDTENTDYDEIVEKAIETVSHGDRRGVQEISTFEWDDAEGDAGMAVEQIGEYQQPEDGPMDDMGGHDYEDNFDYEGSMPSAQYSQGGVSIGLGEEAIQWLVTAGHDGGGPVTGAGWIGPSHWRYRAGPHSNSASNQTEKPKRSKAAIQPLDFVSLLESEDPKIVLDRSFKKKRRSKASSGSTQTGPSKTLLPDDYRYSAEMLGRYSLRPGFISVLHSRQRGHPGGDTYAGYDDSSWDLPGDHDEGGWDMGESEGLDLAEAAHKVEKVEVSYSKAAKQVDVKTLKELMWQGISAVLEQRIADEISNPHEGIEFADILATVPHENNAGRLEDLSVHLCFICVLHLANEHGLAINSFPQLDRLTVGHVPTL